MKQQIISLLERAKENGATIGDVLVQVRGMRPDCAQHAETKLEWITTPDIRDVPDCVLTPSGVALKQSQTSAQDERPQVAPKAKRCVACEGAPSGDNIPCAVCGADPAPQPSENPLSDEYVNAVIRRHGYDSPECVIARLHQWIGLHGGENGVTLLMYEAHKALVKLRTPVGDERDELRGALRAFVDFAAQRRAELGMLSPEMEAIDTRARATLASAPVAGEAQADDLNKKLFEAAILDLAAISEHLGLDPDEGGAEPIIGAIDELRRERDSWVDAQHAAAGEAAPQASPAADGRDAKDAERWRKIVSQWRIHRVETFDGITLSNAGGLGWDILTRQVDAAIAAQQGDKTGTNSGHGHVWERPDGFKARCGGPGFCAQCSRDQAAQQGEGGK